MGDVPRNAHVTQQQKIRPETYPIGGVRRAGSAQVGMRGQCGCQVPAGRESADADTFGVEVEFLGTETDKAQSTLGILQLRGIAIAGREAVFENEGGDALFV